MIHYIVYHLIDILRNYSWFRFPLPYTSFVLHFDFKHLNIYQNVTDIMEVFMKLA